MVQAMPQRPPSPCAEPSCGTLTTEGRCPQHKREQRKQGDSRRSNAHQRGYNRAWGRIAKRYRHQHPLCVACGEAGECVDHITPKARGGEDDDDNLQTMCWACHSKKTAEQDGSFGG